MIHNNCNNKKIKMYDPEHLLLWRHTSSLTKISSRRRILIILKFPFKNNEIVPRRPTLGSPSQQYTVYIARLHSSYTLLVYTPRIHPSSAPSSTLLVYTPCPHPLYAPLVYTPCPPSLPILLVYAPRLQSLSTTLDYKCTRVLSHMIVSTVYAVSTPCPPLQQRSCCLYFAILQSLFYFTYC